MKPGDRVSFQVPPEQTGEPHPIRHGEIYRDWEDGWLEVLVGRNNYLVKKEWFLNNNGEVNEHR